MTTASQDDLSATEIFAVNLAQLAREIAMDVLPIEKIRELHKIEDDEWERIQSNPRFQTMLADMIREWNATVTTKDRVRVKAATAVEQGLDDLVVACADQSIPLTQRVEAFKFLARLGELDGALAIGGSGGSGFHINLNIGEMTKQVKILEGTVAGREIIGAIPE